LERITKVALHWCQSIALCRDPV